MTDEQFKILNDKLNLIVSLLETEPMTLPKCMDAFKGLKGFDEEVKDIDIANFACELAAAHWSYIEMAIRNEYNSEMAEPIGQCFDLDAYCQRVGFHYRTAFMHGFKHGVRHDS